MDKHELDRRLRAVLTAAKDINAVDLASHTVPLITHRLVTYGHDHAKVERQHRTEGTTYQSDVDLANALQDLGSLLGLLTSVPEDVLAKVVAEYRDEIGEGLGLAAEKIQERRDATKATRERVPVDA